MRLINIQRIMSNSVGGVLADALLGQLSCRMIRNFPYVSGPGTGEDQRCLLGLPGGGRGGLD